VADTKISALSAVTAPALNDEFPVNQGGTSKKVSLDTLAQFAAANYFCLLSADYTLTSTTSAQKLFNTTANGALTQGTGLFIFECMFQITGMSGTSGNGVFQFGGTATLANPRLVGAFGLDNTTQVTGAALGGSFVQGGIAATTNIVTAATGTAMSVFIRGLMAITSGGTVIPQIALTTAAAAVVKAGSYIEFEKIGASTDTTRGSWS
jgi:hypothetical protein